MFYQVMSQNLVVHKSEEYRSLACRNIFFEMVKEMRLAEK